MTKNGSNGDIATNNNYLQKLWAYKYQKTQYKPQIWPTSMNTQIKKLNLNKYEHDYSNEVTPFKIPIAS